MIHFWNFILSGIITIPPIVFLYRNIEKHRKTIDKIR